MAKMIREQGRNWRSPEIPDTFYESREGIG